MCCGSKVNKNLMTKPELLSDKEIVVTLLVNGSSKPCQMTLNNSRVLSHMAYYLSTIQYHQPLKKIVP